MKEKKKKKKKKDKKIEYINQKAVQNTVYVTIGTTEKIIKRAFQKTKGCKKLKI